MCKFHSKDFVHVFVNKRKNKFNRYNILARKKCVFINRFRKKFNVENKLSVSQIFHFFDNCKKCAVGIR